VRPTSGFMRAGPNLLNDRLLPTRLGSTLLMLGLACCVLAAWQWYEAQSAADRAQLDLDAAQILSTDVRAPVAAPAGPAQRKATLASGTPLNPARSTEGDQQALQHFLQVDWNRRLHLMEQAASGRIALLGMKLDTQKSMAELRGTVPSIAGLDDFRRQMLDAGASSVRLQRHEVVRDPGATGQMFAAAVEWAK